MGHLNSIKKYGLFSESTAEMEFRRSLSRLKLSNQDLTISISNLSLEDPLKTVKLYDQLMENTPHEKNELFNDMKSSELKNIEILGEGNGGVVYKSLHIPSNMIVARKV